jgi:hypothetical protein
VSAFNYRVLALRPPDGYPDTGICLQLCYVYYDDDGKPNGYADTPLNVCGDSIEDIHWMLDHMREALLKPILWYGDRFPEEYKP